MLPSPFLGGRWLQLALHGLQPLALQIALSPTPYIGPKPKPYTSGLPGLKDSGPVRFLGKPLAAIACALSLSLFPSLSLSRYRYIDIDIDIGIGIGRYR